MSSQAGLSLDQAPPLRVPLRFFLTAPLFLLAAGLLLVVAPESLSSRWTPQALALTHAVTLGFLAMTMIGAMMQMLPVVAGSAVPAAKPVAWLVHLPLLLGTAALMAGFLGAGTAYFMPGTAFLALGFTAFVTAAGISLARAPTNPTVTGMRLALVSLALTVSLGIMLALMRAGWTLPLAPLIASTAHVAFGLAGWVLLLVIGVAYQVVPMFQITPPYPPRLARWLAGLLFVFLLAGATAPLLPASLAGPTKLLSSVGVTACILTFALATLKLQSVRRRKLPDVTLDFWRLGMASLIACVAVWLAAQIWPAWRQNPAYPLLLGLLFLIGFAASVVMGMLYKIVPFLAWFHLQAQLQAKAGSIPNMKQMIAESRMRMQFRLHLAAALLLAAAAFKPSWFAALAGLLVAVSALLLAANLISVPRRYLDHGGRL